jgi:hypothetical protein
MLDDELNRLGELPVDGALITRLADLVNNEIIDEVPPYIIDRIVAYDRSHTLHDRAGSNFITHKSRRRLRLEQGEEHSYLSQLVTCISDSDSDARGCLLETRSLDSLTVLQWICQFGHSDTIYCLGYPPDYIVNADSNISLFHYMCCWKGYDVDQRYYLLRDYTGATPLDWHLLNGGTFTLPITRETYRELLNNRTSVDRGSFSFIIPAGSNFVDIVRQIGDEDMLLSLVDLLIGGFIPPLL